MSLAELLSTMEGLASASERLNQSSREAVREMQSSRRAAALDAVANGIAASLWQNWMQIASVDANSPALPLLEREIKRWSGQDISFLSGLRRELSRAQQRKAARAGATGRRAGAGFLSQDEFTDILSQYTGGG